MADPSHAIIIHPAQAENSLMTMLPEIRNLIYTYLLDGPCELSYRPPQPALQRYDYPRFPCTLEGDSSAEHSWQCNVKSAWNMAHTCIAARSEVLSILYGTKTHRFPTMTDMEKCLHTMPMIRDLARCIIVEWQHNELSLGGNPKLAFELLRNSCRSLESVYFIVDRSTVQIRDLRGKNSVEGLFRPGSRLAKVGFGSGEYWLSEPINDGSKYASDNVRRLVYGCDHEWSSCGQCEPSASDGSSSESSEIADTAAKPSGSGDRNC